MIHICYGLHDKDGRYSKFTGASIVSIFENSTAPPRFITVHILHDNTLSQGNRDKFNQLVGRYNQVIKFYNVEEIFKDKIEEIRQNFLNSIGTYSIATMYRLFIPNLFSEETSKVIYLDSDVLLNLNINELWNIELGEKILAAVPEILQGNPTHLFAMCADGWVKPENYFNAGVILFNLNHWKEQTKILLNGIKFVAENLNRYSFFDQDILNYCFSDSMVRLPKKFNNMVKEARYHNNFEIENRILHFNGTSISLGVSLNMNDIFNRLWFKYFAKTPWFDEEIFSHIYEGVQQIYIWQKNFLTQVSAIQANKSRAFFVQPQNIPAVKQIFAVKESEEIIELVSEESIKNLIQSMKKSDGEKIFYILVPNYRFIQNILTQEGFIDGRDFINGSEFLSDANGVPMNTYPLIKFL